MYHRVKDFDDEKCVWRCPCGFSNSDIHIMQNHARFANRPKNELNFLKSKLKKRDQKLFGLIK